MRDVKMRPIFLLIVFILPTMAHAQWTEQDSLRLQEFLSGKEEIRLNPEFQKAIESGTFLRPDQPGTHMLSSPSELPITKDFSEYVQLDTLRRLTNYDSITPVLFMLLNFKSPSRSLAIQKQAHTIRLPKNQDWKEFKVGKVPMAANVKLTNIYSDVVKDGQRRGGVLATIRVYFDAEDLLETMRLLSKPFSLSFVLSEKIRPNDIRNGRFDGEFSILFYNIKTKCHIFVLVFLL